MTRRFALLDEIASTPAAVRAFDVAAATPAALAFRATRRLMVTGEGSSRIFPARRAIAAWLRRAGDGTVATAGCREAAAMSLDRWTVLALSRSGKTGEVLDLVRRLRDARHDRVFEAGRDDERAFPATRSVVREALFVEACLDPDGLPGRLAPIADGIAAALAAEPAPAALATLASARHVYFSGPDDGVAEELALKCIEIARKPSAFFEGNYALHGAHATLGPGDVVVAVATPPVDAERMRARVERTGAAWLDLPAPAGADEFGRLAAGWRLLAATGLALGVDLDGDDLRVS